MWFLSQATDSQVEFHIKLLQIEAHKVAHFDMLEVIPHPFSRIEIWSIGRQLFQMNLVCTDFRDVLLDCGTAMDRRALQNHQQSSVHHTHEMLQERDRMQPFNDS